MFNANSKNKYEPSSKSLFENWLLSHLTLYATHSTSEF